MPPAFAGWRCRGMRPHSAFTATIASMAVGPERVLAVFMPTRFSSQQSLNDSKKLAKNLGIDFKVISIEEMRKFCLRELEENIGVTEPNVAIGAVCLLRPSNTRSASPLASASGSGSC